MFKIRKEQKDAFTAAFGTMATPCTWCLVLRTVEIKGLFKPGHDDRVNPRPGTTKGAGYQPGYASEDDRGRIFINRETNGTDDPKTGRWVRDTQGIEITVRVDPPSVPIPPGTVIEWSYEDPDDPTNEDPIVHRDAGKLLDPNDYLGEGKKGAWKIGANPDDNHPKGKAKTKFAQLEPKFPLSGANQTPVDPRTRESKVRFLVSDFAGDNYRVKAEIKAGPPIVSTVPAETGIMTVWNRIEIEYVRMASARDIPVADVAPHFELACAQIDISDNRVIGGFGDKPLMGPTDGEGRKECNRYASRNGHFTHEGKAGWFFVGAVNRLCPVIPREVLGEVRATAHGFYLSVPEADYSGKDPAAVKICKPNRTTRPAKDWSKDPKLWTAFEVKYTIRSSPWIHLWLKPHEFYEVDDPDHPIVSAYLDYYGFDDGAQIDVQLLSTGSVVMGTNAGTFEDEKGHTWFAGKVFVFTQDNPPAEDLGTLCHELCHAFDNAHNCGNWDYTNKAERTSCAMNYAFFFVLDDAFPRKPIPWTQRRTSADLCGPHLRHLRDYHLQDNIALKWRNP